MDDGRSRVESESQDETGFRFEGVRNVKRAVRGTFVMWGYGFARQQHRNVGDRKGCESRLSSPCNICLRKVS